MPPAYRNQFIIFQYVRDPSRFVEVLAGETAPTPSGGYAKWAHIARPQRTALTILEGYEPMILTVPVLFDAVRETGKEEDVEQQIQRLEGFAGRGIVLPPGFQDGIGKPPLLKVYAAAGNEREIPLIPKPFQIPALEWFIDDLTFDEHALRSTGGARTRQPVTVRLVQYVKDPQLKEPKKTGYRIWHTTAGANTIKKLVVAHLQGPRRISEAVKDTLKDNTFNRKIGHNPDKPLPNHTPVRIRREFTDEA